MRYDLRVALSLKASRSLEDLFINVRDDWAATQQETKGSAVPFTKDIAVRGRLVLLRGRKIDLDIDDRSPRLESIFAPVAANDPVHVEFSTTGENFDRGSDKGRLRPGGDRRIAPDCRPAAG